MYYTYIIQSLKNSRWHTGSTNNMQRRLAEHNNGKSKYMRLTKPFKLIYCEKYQTRLEAIKRELYFKTGKGREEVKVIITRV